MTANKTVGVLRVGAFERTFDAELAARYEIPELPAGPQRAKFLAERGAGVRVVVTSGPPGVDAGTMAALPNLEVIVNYGAGVDSIDLGEAKRRGIGVSNTPDVLSDSVADTALGLILMTLRRFGAADRYVRAGRWAREGPFGYARDVSGLQVGNLGPGANRIRYRDQVARIRLCHRLSQPAPDRRLALPVCGVAPEIGRVGRRPGRGHHR